MRVTHKFAVRRFAVCTFLLVLLLTVERHTLGQPEAARAETGAQQAGTVGLRVYQPLVIKRGVPAMLPTQTPFPPGTNLLQNPQFLNETGDGCSLDGWSQLKGYWQCSYKPAISPPPGSSSRGKLDNGELSGGSFPPGSSDILWQTVQVSAPHTGLIFEITEVQHEFGFGERRLYGRTGSGPWVLLWSTPFEASFAVPPPMEDDWESFSYTIPLAHTYDQYKVEFFLQPVGPYSGWKFNNLLLTLITND